MPELEDALEKGFQLAHFLVPSRPDALEILGEALNRLAAQRHREKRRTYWRDKYLKRGITRVTREEADTLQWLILFESDRFEKEQESRGEQTATDMAVRYIKSLVRITTAMSSFYVNVGLHRLLNNYTTPEIQRVYETITDRYLGADEYRRAKSVLMTKLERRFGRLLRTCRTQYGELRFEAWDDQEPWRALAEKCLHALTPWSTAHNCPVPADFGPDSAGIPPQLTSASDADLTPDQLEMNRCHVFIDPGCYTRLTRALAFDPPEKRLALPRFFMETENSENKPAPTPSLTAEERRALNDRVSRESQRRHDSVAECIRVVIDGVEQGRFDLSRQTRWSAEIDEGTELIELLAGTAGDDLLLASHRVQYTPAQGIAPSHLTLKIGRRKLLLNISPGPTPVGEQPHRALMTVSGEAQEAAKKQSAVSLTWRVSGYAAALLVLFAAGWIARGQLSQKPGQPIAEFASPASISTGAAKKTADTNIVAVYKSYELLADEEITRSNGGPQFPTVFLPTEPGLVRLDLPIPPGVTARTFVATLRLFENSNVLLAESIPRPAAGTNRILEFWVPTTLLSGKRQYSVSLRSGASREELSSYSFQAELSLH